MGDSYPKRDKSHRGKNDEDVVMESGGLDMVVVVVVVEMIVVEEEGVGVHVAVAVAEEEDLVKAAVSDDDGDEESSRSNTKPNPCMRSDPYTVLSIYLLDGTCNEQQWTSS
jgi:hypothetical protein